MQTPGFQTWIGELNTLFCNSVGYAHRSIYMWSFLITCTFDFIQLYAHAHISPSEGPVGTTSDDFGTQVLCYVLLRIFIYYVYIHTVFINPHSEEIQETKRPTATTNISIQY